MRFLPVSFHIMLECQGEQIIKLCMDLSHRLELFISLDNLITRRYVVENFGMHIFRLFLPDLLLLLSFHLEGWIFNLMQKIWVEIDGVKFHWDIRAFHCDDVQESALRLIFRRKEIVELA